MVECKDIGSSLTGKNQKGPIFFVLYHMDDMQY